MQLSSKSNFSALRLKAGLSIAEVASQLELPVRRITAYESGDTKPGAREIQILRGLAALTEKSATRNANEGQSRSFTFCEFFAGGGMARLGLGPNWRCLFANDIDERKAAAYSTNHGAEQLHVKDIGEVKSSELPNSMDVVWASFPCQDLSLAGAGAGLAGGRSGTFWPFWRLVCDLVGTKRTPKIVVLENVYGALTSHSGKDFLAISEALTAVDYKFGALVVDAVHFLPQSRPRLFIIAARKDLSVPDPLISNGPSNPWHPKALLQANSILPEHVASKWVWWNLPIPPKRNIELSDLIEENPAGICWHTEPETQNLLRMMSPRNRAKVDGVQHLGRRVVGTIYRRTRLDEHGKKLQRAEVRFDGVSGCLRTPAGGSSRQTIIVINGDSIRSRLLSSREAARLMGLPDEYKLPSRYNDAYHLAGDGVAVPVVRYLAEKILEPLIAIEQPASGAVAP